MAMDPDGDTTVYGLQRSYEIVILNTAEIEGYVTVSPDQWDDVKSSVGLINQMIAEVEAKENVEDNDPGIMEQLDAYINSLKGDILGAFTIIYGQNGSNGTESWNNASGKDRFQLPSQDAGDLSALFMAASKLNGPGRVTVPRGGGFIQDALPEVTKKSTSIIKLLENENMVNYNIMTPIGNGGQMVDHGSIKKSKIDSLKSNFR